MHRQCFTVVFSATLFVLALPLAALAQAPTTPTLTTEATPSVMLGEPISDTATLSGATNDAGGTITFKLYSTLADCQAGTNEITTGLQPVTVNGNDNYISGNFTPSAPGTYFWTASYSGDANNAAANENSCAANEQSVVNQAGPTLVTQASGPVMLGEPISDVATLDVPEGTTGTIEFKLYGPFTTAPGSDDCTTPIEGAGSTKTVTAFDPANPTFTSDPYTPTEAGIYNWTATFTPDSGQGDPTGEIGCGEVVEQSVVSNEATTTPTLTTDATDTATLPDGTISDTATLSGGDNPTGTIMFTVYGPDDEDCSGDPAFTSEVDVNGNGDYSSEEFVPSSAGTYRWTADYSGDANNEAVTSECNAENEQSVVNDDGGGGNGGGGNGDGGGGNGSGGGNNNRHHHNRFHNNRFFGRGAANIQFRSERIVEERVIKETIPNKGRLANTGGVPLTGAAVLALASVGLGVSILRFAVRRER